MAEQKQELSLIQDFSSWTGIQGAQVLDTLKGTIMDPNATQPQLIAFMQVCNIHRLNPFTKEIHAFFKGGKMHCIVGIDGWVKKANEHPQYDGFEFEDVMANGKCVAINCTIYRKDRARPAKTTEYMSECMRADVDTWKKWPIRMLRHKAFIQCARMAFGFAGIMDEDEFDRMKEAEVVQEIQQPQRVKPAAQVQHDPTIKEVKATDVTPEPTKEVTSQAKAKPAKGARADTPTPEATAKGESAQRKPAAQSAAPASSGTASAPTPEADEIPFGSTVEPGDGDLADETPADLVLDEPDATKPADLSIFNGKDGRFKIRIDGEWTLVEQRVGAKKSWKGSIAIGQGDDARYYGTFDTKIGDWLKTYQGKPIQVYYQERAGTNQFEGKTFTDCKWVTEA